MSADAQASPKCGSIQMWEPISKFNERCKYLNNEKLSHDLYVAAYHDQVLPLIKGIGGLRAINLTVGLPYIRLSVDHGTGFDIVNRDIASPEGFESCLNFCKNTENIIFSGNI